MTIESKNIWIKNNENLFSLVNCITIDFDERVGINITFFFEDHYHIVLFDDNEQRNVFMKRLKEYLFKDLPNKRVLLDPKEPKTLF